MEEGSSPTGRHTIDAIFLPSKDRHFNSNFAIPVLWEQIDVTLKEGNIGVPVFKASSFTGLTWGHAVFVSCDAKAHTSSTDPSLWIADKLCKLDRSATLLVRGAMVVKNSKEGEPFSKEGDSGSIVWTLVGESIEPIGMIAAGSIYITVIVPIEPIRRALDVEILAPEVPRAQGQSWANIVRHWWKKIH